MNKAQETCLIVIDSGFSEESLRDARVIAVRDLSTDVTLIGAPLVGEQELQHFAHDPLNHGSIVLQNLRKLAPDAPVILIRVIGEEGKIIRTSWRSGEIVSEGWTEAYIWAVELCKQRGLTSVANCSFGGVTHAADGTGWESHQLASVTGAALPGHVLVAASGPGDGRSVHASWLTEPGATRWVAARQSGSTQYNFWAGSAHQGWWLTVRLNGEVVGRYDGAWLDGNMWNQRQQLTFDVDGQGDVSFEFTLAAEGQATLKCDCWVRGEDSSRFLNYVDARLIAEPAVLPHVIATGFRSGSYSPDQRNSDAKPDVLVDGGGQISFRTPEITVAAARLLSADRTLDVVAVKQLLRLSHPK
jgi:hypothetical protein